jgi:hypothetical protein
LRGNTRDPEARVFGAERVFGGKQRNESAVKPLKINDSAKSRHFAPNDFNDLPFRFVSLGEMLASFGARFRSRQVRNRL